jgi:putative restriction endonuclease
MRYWWVNHKQTFQQEFAGGYVWCPKRFKDGRVNHFYETLREVRPGDLVLSYAHAAVQGFGFARTHAYSCPRPNEFGKVGQSWDLRGWRADISFKRFACPLRTADHAQHLARYLPERYSPIKRDGFGNQGAYFSEIPEALAWAIAALAEPTLYHMLRGNLLEDRPEDDVEVELPALFDWEERQQQLIEKGLGVPETTRTALIHARIGQGLFKQNVMRWERACRITMVDNPTHLIASHIKPWRESDNEERLAAGNGLLLTPSIDHLFDRGFISFSDEGDLILSPIADKVSLQRMGVPPANGFKIRQFNGDQRHFLNYHRNEILLKSAG